MSKKLTAVDKELRQMALQANRQLTSLEKNKMRSAPAYKATQKNYMNADKFKSRYLGKNKSRPRFRTDVGKMSKREKNMLRSRVLDFLDMKTSTPQGVEDMYSASKEKFEETWGSELGYDEYLNMWEKSITEEMVKQLGSSQIEGLLSTMSANNMTASQMEQFLKANKDASDIDTLYSALGNEPRERASNRKVSKTTYTNKSGFYKV